LKRNTKIHIDRDSDTRLMDAAGEIVSAVGGDIAECFDWLKNGSWGGGVQTVNDLIDKWHEREMERRS